MNTDDLWQRSLGSLIQPGEVLADKYRADRLLGVGGMGVVLEAWHLSFEERVAIKLLIPKGSDPSQSPSLDEEAVARFEREARAAFKLKSEHAAKVYDVGRLPNGIPFMVLEFLEGMDLGQLVASQGPLPVGDAVRLLLQAGEAIAEAHRRGIVHRDLKPENLFLTYRPDNSPCIKILDFGISKDTSLEKGPNPETSLTQVDAIMGTPLYMSPEQWVCSRDVGPGSDIWSLGVILFELLTGQPPFEHAQLAKLCAMVLNSPPPPLAILRPEVPPELVEVIDRCLEKLIVRRYGNMAELAVALAPFGGPGALRSCERIIDLLDASAPVTRSSGLAIQMAAGQSGPGLTDPVRNLSSAPPTSRTWHDVRPPALRSSRGRLIAAAGVAACLALGAAGLGGVFSGRDAPVTPASNNASTTRQLHPNQPSEDSAEPASGPAAPLVGAASTAERRANPTDNAGGAGGQPAASSGVTRPPGWRARPVTAPIKRTAPMASSTRASKPAAVAPKPSARTCGEDGFDRCR